MRYGAEAAMPAKINDGLTNKQRYRLRHGERVRAEEAAHKQSRWRQRPLPPARLLVKNGANRIVTKLGLWLRRGVKRQLALPQRSAANATPRRPAVSRVGVATKSPKSNWLR